MKNIEVIEKFVKGMNGNYSNYTKNLHSLSGVYLKNYNTIIAVNRGDVIYVNNNKYSVTTTKKQNLVCREAEKLGLKIRTTAKIEEVM